MVKTPKKLNVPKNNSDAKAGEKISGGGFALLSKDASVWKDWNESKDAVKIEIGNILGNGLDSADHIFLYNQKGETVDAVSWGSDTSAFNPSIAGVAIGHSIERLVPGFDGDNASDWVDRSPPTPGR